ncbi:MAG: glycosyltransferase family 2 protein [Granulosicoccaceae bacterium]
MIILFSSMVFFCIYTYAVFPIVMHFLARCRPVLKPSAPSDWPSVSIVIALHNEEHNLYKKYNGLKLLDYPQERLEFVLVSDGSTDGTWPALQQIASADSRIVAHHYDQAAGKPSALNVALKKATGKIIVFMDARQSVSANAVKTLVSYLQDPKIGAVSGELVLGSPDTDGANDAANVGLYWLYEKWIRENESRWYSTTGATGALYAIRKSDYLPHAADVLLDDFDTPVKLLKQGKRTVFASEAKVYDVAEASSSIEFKRKVRTLAGNFQSFSRQSWLFNLAINPVWWQFLSHKVFRLLVPYAMVIAFLASVLGGGLFLNTMLVLQCLFYGLGIISFLTKSRNSVLNFIKVFLQLNAAAVLGAYRFITAQASVRWKQS